MPGYRDLLHPCWRIGYGSARDVGSLCFAFGILPYEEYFPCEAELALLEKQEPTLFETYRELMCHLYICSSMHGSSKGASCSLKSWGDYLFPDMENAPEAAHYGVADEDIFRRI